MVISMPQVRIIWDMPHHSLRRVVLFNHGPEFDPQYDRQALAILFQRIRQRMEMDGPATIRLKNLIAPRKKKRHRRRKNG